MKKLLLLLFTTCLIQGSYGQVVYEDFENGALLNWNALNGTYDGVFENPDTTGINTSDSVGSYTKSDQHAFSLFLAELPTPMDLSVNNEFRIQINAPVASQVLLKLEGTGQAIEMVKNITTTNVWREYVFDFSGADTFSSLTKIIIFFDPGTESSGDTYLFDNLAAYPAGPCAGTVPDPDILDDFECQRNVSYGGGYTQLEVVSNPDPTGINTSAAVGKYTDPQDEWSALAIDYNSPIDLSVKNTFAAKIWAPKTGNLLFKLEGGVSPPSELFIAVTDTNTWVEYEANFSDQAQANHKRLAIFFNAGVLADSGDIYYLDDIVRKETPMTAVWEDFEDTAKLVWQPLNGDMALHGTYNGVVNNPDASGANTSPNVGSYNKGSSGLSTLTGFFPSPLDLATFPQINLDVLAPAGVDSVRMQLVSSSQGVKSATRSLEGATGWASLSFDFSTFSSITDFTQVNIIFDPGNVNSSTFYYDNLAQGITTVDACEGVDPIANRYDDFECQRNVTYSAGGDRLEVVDNPDISAENSSAKVGKYKDPTDEWSALALDFGATIDLTTYNQFHIKIWSPIAAPLKFKLEGGTSSPIEIDTTVSNTQSWQEYVVDFSPYAGEDHQRIVIFFNAGVLPTQEDEYFIDDLFIARASITGCAIDYESPISSLNSFQYFANGHLETEGFAFKSVENPDKTGINLSDKVGEFVKASDGATFAGMFGDLDAPLDFGGNKTMKAKVWMDHIGNFAIKLEGSRTGADPIEVPVANTQTNAWEELSFDFSSAPDDAQFSRLTLFFDLGLDATGVDVTSYFDDIIVGDGNCATVGIKDLMALPQIKAYPNPVSETLRIDDLAQVDRIEVMNSMGQLIASYPVFQQQSLQVEVSTWAPGVYFLLSYQGNNLSARSKVLKQ